MVSLGGDFTADNTGTTGLTWQHWNDTASTGTSTTAWVDWNIQHEQQLWQICWQTWTNSQTFAAIDLQSALACAQATQAAQTLNSQIWTTWANCGADSTAYDFSGRVRVLEPETREQVAERRRQEEERERERKADEERAKELLVSHLAPEQKKELEEKGGITVESQTGKQYVIKRGRAGNVYRLQDGKHVERYCIHPVDGVPDWDTMLSQFLWLKFCEEDFVKTANVTKLAA